MVEAALGAVVQLMELRDGLTLTWEAPERRETCTCSEVSADTGAWGPNEIPQSIISTKQLI